MVAGATSVVTFCPARWKGSKGEGHLRPGMARLPLFPLQTVLFPFGHLPLYVFEPRYRRLVVDCQGSGSGFGVVLIKEGVEVGGPAIPHPVGTEGHVTAVDLLPDGELHLLVTGRRRFLIRTLHFEKPYLEGTVDWLHEPEESPRNLRPWQALVEPLFRDFLNEQRASGEFYFDEVWHESSPHAYAYKIAEALPLQPFAKQELLELGSTEQRLKRELDVLLALRASALEAMPN